MAVAWRGVRKSQRKFAFPQSPRGRYNLGMGHSILAVWGTAYAALLLWLVVRVVNRPESWGMAITVPVIAGCAGGTWTLVLLEVLKRQ